MQNPIKGSSVIVHYYPFKKLKNMTSIQKINFITGLIGMICIMVGSSFQPYEAGDMAIDITPKIKTDTLAVQGCCLKCATRIETAVLDIKGVVFAQWDKHSKQLVVTYKTKFTDRNAILDKVAAVGHDTEERLADDAVYEKLPSCCKYRGGGTCTH